MNEPSFLDLPNTDMLPTAELGSYVVTHISTLQLTDKTLGKQEDGAKQLGSDELWVFSSFVLNASYATALYKLTS